MQRNPRKKREAGNLFRSLPHDSTTSSTASTQSERVQQRKHWGSLFDWFQAATFSPDWVAAPWSRPATGYILALLVQPLVFLLITLLAQVFPTLRFYESITLLVVFFIACGWGAGPALIATCAGAIGLLLLWLPSSTSAEISQLEHIVRFILYMGAGLTIGILTGRIQQARYAAQAFGQRLEEIIDALPHPLVFYDAQGRAIQYNAVARQLITTKERDLPLEQMVELLNIHDVEGRRLSSGDWPLARALRGDAVANMELRYHHSAGAAERAIAVSATPLRAQTHDTIIGAVTMTHDLSALRNAEYEATRRAQQLEAMLEAVPDALFLVNRDSQTIRMNQAARRLLAIDEMQEEALLGSNVAEGLQLHIHDANGVPLPVEQWASSRILRGEVLDASNAMELILRAPNGRETLVNMTGGPIYDANQCIVGGVTVARDITEIREVERRARASEHEAAERGRQLEATFNAMTDGVVIYDASGHMVRINDAYTKLIGLAKEPEHTAATPAERAAVLAVRNEHGHLLTEEQQPVQRMLAGEVFTASQAVDIQVHTLDDREVQLNITGTPMYDQEEHLTGGVLIFRDVTERRTLERRTQEALEALLTMAEELVHLPEHAEQQEEATKASTGVSKPLAELIRRVLGCERVTLTGVDQATHTLYSLAAVGLTPEQERQWYARKPGFYLSETLADPSFSSSGTLSLEGPQVIDFTQPPLCNLPNPFDIQMMIITPMKIGTQLIGVMLLDYGKHPHIYTQAELSLTRAVADLSALVIERERLQRDQATAQASALALHETNRMMDEFIGIAGHELRTPLTTVKASVQLANRQLTRLLSHPGTLPETIDKQIAVVKGHLDRTERQIGMQSRLVRDLLDVSRIHADRLELHPELCNLVTLIREVVEDQNYLTPQRTLELTLNAPEEVLVLADADRIRQVVSNYLSNALKYSEASKPVRISIDQLETQVRVSVSDEGPGLTPEQQQRIWERFYRAPGIEVRTGSGVGLGLGLHISRTIIERHDGQLGVQSEPPHGSTFWFTLPLAEQKEV